MPRRAIASPTADVKKVLQAVKEKPELLQAINAALAQASAAANVTLSQAEKASLLHELAKITAGGGGIDGWI